MTATHVLLTCEQPSPLSLSPSLSLAVSLFPMAGACDIRRIARPRRVLSIVRLDHQFQTIACQSERKKVKESGNGIFFFFFFSISAFRSNRSEITTRKIVKGKKTRVSRVKFASFAIVSRRARTFSTIVIRCLLYVFPRVFPALTKFRDSQAK